LSAGRSRFDSLFTLSLSSKVTSEDVTGFEPPALRPEVSTLNAVEFSKTAPLLPAA